MDTSVPNCQCGVSSAQRTVRKSGPNEGRLFYACAKSQDSLSRCDFFQFEDDKENRAGQSQHRPEQYFQQQGETDAPICGCGTQSVSRIVRKSGPNEGRKFYTCAQPQESTSRCGFFQFADDDSRRPVFIISYSLSRNSSTWPQPTCRMTAVKRVNAACKLCCKHAETDQMPEGSFTFA